MVLSLVKFHLRKIIQFSVQRLYYSKAIGYRLHRLTCGLLCWKVPACEELLVSLDLFKGTPKCQILLVLDCCSGVRQVL